ncbi:unnamed protein product [Calypogeia fissa]
MSTWFAIVLSIAENILSNCIWDFLAWLPADVIWKYFCTKISAIWKYLSTVFLWRDYEDQQAEHPLLQSKIQPELELEEFHSSRDHVVVDMEQDDNMESDFEEADGDNPLSGLTLEGDIGWVWGSNTLSRRSLE